MTDQVFCWQKCLQWPFATSGCLHSGKMLAPQIFNVTCVPLPCDYCCGDWQKFQKAIPSSFAKEHPVPHTLFSSDAVWPRVTIVEIAKGCRRPSVFDKGIRGLACTVLKFSTASRPSGFRPDFAWASDFSQFVCTAQKPDTSFNAAPALISWFFFTRQFIRKLLFFLVSTRMSVKAEADSRMLLFVWRQQQQCLRIYDFTTKTDRRSLAFVLCINLEQKCSNKEGNETNGGSNPHAEYRFTLFEQWKSHQCGFQNVVSGYAWE